MRELCTPPVYVFLIGVVMLFLALYLGILAATCIAVRKIDRHQRTCPDTDELRWTRVEAGEIL